MSSFSFLLALALAHSPVNANGAPETFKTCRVNPTPMVLPGAVFHAMPHDDSNRVPLECLFEFNSQRPLRASFAFGSSELEFEYVFYLDSRGAGAAARVSQAFDGNAKLVVVHEAQESVYSQVGHTLKLGEIAALKIVQIFVGPKVFTGLIDLRTVNGGPMHEAADKLVEIGFLRNWLTAGLGDFPQASLLRLSKAYLQTLSKTELKLMRNEIFARYGYQFKKGGNMNTHFETKSWYAKIPAAKGNIQQKLSLIEKQNIAAIRALER